jgi:hypothetical protein
LLSHQEAKIQGRSLDSLVDEGAAADVAAAFDRGEPVVALLVDGAKSERSNVLGLLREHLAWRKDTRVIQIDGLECEAVDVRRFCHLLITASSKGAIVGDPTEHLTRILTAPCAGERSITLIVENADVLSPDALVFASRLAVASAAQPFRMQVLLVGPTAIQDRLAVVKPVVIKRFAGFLVQGLEPFATPRRTRKLRLPLVAVGCIAGVVVFAAIHPGNDRLSLQVGSTVETLPPSASTSTSFTGADVSSATVPPESTPPRPSTASRQPVPLYPVQSSSTSPPARSASLAPPEGTAPPLVDVVPDEVNAVFGTLPKLRTLTANPSAEPLPETESEASELIARSYGLFASVDALLTRTPTKGSAPTDMGYSETPAKAIERPSIPVPVAEALLPDATARAAALPDPEPSIFPLVRAESLPAPVGPEGAIALATTATVDSARAAVELPVGPTMHNESFAIAVRDAETAVPNAEAAASAGQSATKPQRLVSGAKPATVAALLARGDGLIAIGDVAAARLVYQRAAALDSARAATAMGKTYDLRFLQAIGAIGVVADVDGAAAWYRKGVALGDEDAAALLGDLDARASR